MKHELTRRIFTACMLVFVLTIGLVLFVMERYQEKQARSEVQEQTEDLISVIAESGTELLGQFTDAGQMEITVFAKDGTVRFASGSAPETGEAFQDALAGGTGRSETWEGPLHRRFTYAAQLPNGQSVIQVSIKQDPVWALLLNMATPLLVLVLLMVLLSMLIAAQFSMKIMKPINALDVENPDDRDIYDEMKPFVRQIMTQNQQIYRQMSELKEEHRKQDAMRREFTANVSHELKTPLTSISGFAEIMRDGMVQEKDIAHFADNIYHEAQRLILLVNDILKLSRLEADGSQQEERTSVELFGLCREAASRLSLNAAKQDVALSCEGEQVTVSGMRRLLEEIVYNVCDNAIKYNREGGSVRMTTGTEDGMAFVRVQDNGIGIPLADQGRIFERFYRVNKSHSKEVGGTGLGLSIVKHGMLLHGGEITLKSAPDWGTEITLWFPLGTETPQTPAN